MVHPLLALMDFHPDAVNFLSGMSLELHPRCIFYGIEDVFLAEFVTK